MSVPLNQLLFEMSLFETEPSQQLFFKGLLKIILQFRNKTCGESIAEYIAGINNCRSR